ncbi:Electron transport complex subunit RsxE [Serratia symbiotica]|nr:Electron transport complex subunit RsxE [Serratia symbiotica]
MNKIKNILIQGIWKNNSALNQILGMCPLLAVTSTVINAIGLGLATTLVLILTNTFISIIRKWIIHEIRIPIYVMIIAAIVSIVQMLIHAYTFNLYKSLGIFIPLIVTNCIVVGRAEAVASKNSITLAILDGIAIGFGATIIMVLLGIIRELLSTGTILNNADILLGNWAKLLCIHLIHFNNPFLLAILPPGAFITLGLLISLKDLIDKKK